MSTTSVASEYFRYFTGIASISINMPYRTGVAHRSCRQCNSPVIELLRSQQWYNDGCYVVYSPWRKRGQNALGGVVRDSNEAEYCLKTHVLIPIVEPTRPDLKFDDQHVPNGLSV
eukprot:scaffold27207_cov78-Skeletonema_dohrnii-CCMP3373.AAC.1